MEAAIATVIADRRPFDFGELALAVFAYQFEHNEPYREYCRRRGRTPRSVDRWRAIPPVPTSAFKIVDLTCGAPERVFLTSGTTRGQRARGRHLVAHLDLYRTAALAHFSACVAVEGDRRPVLALGPSPALRPESSLGQMIAWIRDAYGTDDSAYFVTPQGLETEALCERLDVATATGRPLYLIGVTAAFEDLFSHCQRTGRAFRLGYGSVVVDTGGNKRGRGLSRAGFLHACWRVLNVPGYHCINEYGMTELCSQFYDNALLERRAGRFTPRYKIGPPWTRTLVVDPDTLEEAPPGTKGILLHFDLANCGSVLAVQTEDIGVAVADGFEITGRLLGAEARGCALLLDDMTRNDADLVASSARPR